MSDIEKVKKLREVTGAGFKDCNSAVKESKGDLDKAIEILRIKGKLLKLLNNIKNFSKINQEIENMNLNLLSNFLELGTHILYFFQI